MHCEGKGLCSQALCVLRFELSIRSSISIELWPSELSRNLFFSIFSCTVFNFYILLELACFLPFLALRETTLFSLCTRHCPMLCIPLSPATVFAWQRLHRIRYEIAHFPIFTLKVFQSQISRNHRELTKRQFELHTKNVRLDFSGIFICIQIIVSQ